MQELARRIHADGRQVDILTAASLMQEPGRVAPALDLGDASAVRVIAGRVPTDTRSIRIPRGPEGPDTWMLEIGPDGRYLGMTNALSAKNLARVQPGMSREELLRMLGRPGSEQALRRAGEVVLTWRVRTADGANTTEMFNVHLGPDRRVRRTSRSADPERIMGG
ncbi:MAG: outer membrane protein assembly factor BamE [Burkholderiaceae bacterium]|nr:outer membrane protein assembly factor BamE [Burkholderiaceae bacterium]